LSVGRVAAVPGRPVSVKEIGTAPSASKAVVPVEVWISSQPPVVPARWR
jgi:hypothetical protein